MIIIIIPNIFLAHTPAGAELDSNPTAAAPSQTEVTDLNCSDHSTTSKEMVACNNNNNNGNPQLVVQLPPQSTTHKTLGVMIDKDVSGKLALPQFQCDGKK